MAVNATSPFSRLRALLPGVQETLAGLGLDGWLLYDLHARNHVTAKLTGLGDLTRRYFVLLPARGEPIALTHGIEQVPWQEWPWRKEVYVGWKPLGEQLARLLGGRARVAMEFSPNDNVPALDLVPAGVVELVRAQGVEVVASGELVTRFYSRWSAAELESHRRSAAILAEVARAAFAHLAEGVRGGETRTEAGMMQWVLDAMRQRGAGAGAECIVATGVNAANPHYAPAGPGASFTKGDVVLLDLWGKESADTVYADQTWMGYLGAEVPARVAELFGVIVDARDAAVEFLRRRSAEGVHVEGREVDDVARGVVRSRGYGDRFIHRTGHSIDRDVHGMGPNIDNLETHDDRRLIPGVGFSIEPGVYIPGEVGLRTEVDVFMTEAGPEVTTPDPQRAVSALGRDWSR